MMKIDVRISPSRSTYYSSRLLPAGYSFSLLPESRVCILSFSCRISTGSLNVMLPAKIDLVVNHRITESETDTAFVALWTNLTISGLCKRYMFVWHRFTYLGQGWAVFECHHSISPSESQRFNSLSATSHDSDNSGFSSSKMDSRTDMALLSPIAPHASAASCRTMMCSALSAKRSIKVSTAAGIVFGQSHMPTHSLTKHY